MKKIIACALAALLLLTAAGAAAECDPLLYRVTDGEGHTVYLLGTIHIGSKDMYPLSDAVNQAYEEAEILAVEMDILALSQDLGAAMQMGLAMMYGPGDDAAQHMTKQNYELAVERIDYPEMVLRRMRLGAWLSLTEEKIYQMAGLSADWGVDMHLLRRAHEDKKQIDELETLELQMDALLGIPDRIAEIQIMSRLTMPAVMADMYQKLFEAWRTGDAENLRRMLDTDDGEMDQLTPELQAEYEQYLNSLWHDRDRGFDQQVKDYLAQGKTVLFAVGAGHVVGTGGIVDQLTEAGYTVEEIGR